MIVFDKEMAQKISNAGSHFWGVVERFDPVIGWEGDHNEGKWKPLPMEDHGMYVVVDTYDFGFVKAWANQTWSGRLFDLCPRGTLVYFHLHHIDYQKDFELSSGNYEFLVRGTLWDENSIFSSKEEWEISQEKQIDWHKV